MDGALSDSPSYAALYTSHAAPSTRPLYATRQHGELRRREVQVVTVLRVQKVMMTKQNVIQ